MFNRDTACDPIVPLTIIKYSRCSNKFFAPPFFPNSRFYCVSIGYNITQLFRSDRLSGDSRSFYRFFSNFRQNSSNSVVKSSSCKLKFSVLNFRCNFFRKIQRSLPIAHASRFRKLEKVNAPYRSKLSHRTENYCSARRGSC